MRLLFAIDGFVYFSCAIAFCECLCTGVSDQMDWGFFLVGSMSTCSCNKEASAARGGAEGGKCATSHRGSLLAPAGTMPARRRALCPTQARPCCRSSLRFLWLSSGLGGVGRDKPHILVAARFVEEQYGGEAVSLRGSKRRILSGQLIRYISSGHYFYITGRIPEHKDAEVVDGKLLALYDADRPKWKRQRRRLLGQAGIHYLRYGRFWVIVLTKGEHSAFYRDHGPHVLDIRRTALKFAGYSVRYSYSELEKRYRVFCAGQTDLQAATRRVSGICSLAEHGRPRQIGGGDRAAHAAFSAVWACARTVCVDPARG